MRDKIRRNPREKEGSMKEKYLGLFNVYEAKQANLHQQRGPPSVRSRRGMNGELTADGTEQMADSELDILQESPDASVVTNTGAKPRVLGTSTLQGSPTWEKQPEISPNPPPNRDPNHHFGLAYWRAGRGEASEVVVKERGLGGLLSRDNQGNNNLPKGGWISHAAHQVPLQELLHTAFASHGLVLFLPHCKRNQTNQYHCPTMTIGLSDVNLG
ncbi:hypothetical protein V8F20_000383 [Naviculisporaceae sp. PSN 640]